MGECFTPFQEAKVSRNSCNRSPRESFAPVFVTGFARSGTTWVNYLLNEYFDLGMVNEGQFILKYARRLERYGDRLPKRVHKKFLRNLQQDDFFAILERNYFIKIDWEKVRLCEPRFSYLVREILCQIADGLGKGRIGSKYPEFGRYLALLDVFFPDALILHVIRDGRDCALSHKSLTWGHQNIYAAARSWSTYVGQVRDYASRICNRYLEVRYEDLLLDREGTLQKLGQFLFREGYDASGCKFRIKNTGREKNEDGATVAKWKKKMKLKDQLLFESVAGEVLADCGYPTIGGTRSISPLAKCFYVAHDQTIREFWWMARLFVKGLPEKKN